MNFILLGPWPEKKSGRESSGRALGELWESSGKPFPPEMFHQLVWNSIGRALEELWERELWESFGRVLGKIRESSERRPGDLWESSARALRKLWVSEPFWIF